MNGPIGFQVQASDYDDGLNGMVQFSLEGNTPPFTISTAGVISKQGDLDYEEQNEYTV